MRSPSQFYNGIYFKNKIVLSLGKNILLNHYFDMDITFKHFEINENCF